MSTKIDVTTVAAVGALVLTVFYLGSSTVAKAAETIGAGVNPASDDNWFNRGFEAIYKKITGSNQAPGADLYDWIHGGEK